MLVLLFVLQCLRHWPSAAAGAAPGAGAAAAGAAGQEVQLPIPRGIIGGSACSSLAFPYVVSIKAGFQMQHVCGGSLLNGHNVLTAGHCGSIPMQMYVVTGQHNFWKVNIDDFQASPVIHVFVHPKYQLLTSNPVYDIAVFRLRHGILETNLTRYVRLPQPGSPVPCQPFEMGGWGRYGPSARGSPLLLCTRLPHIDGRECGQLYAERDLSRTVCTLDRSGRRGVCHGDSGSPVMCGGEQRGLVSWGVQCWGAKYPGVHTDVSRYLGFIRSSLQAATATHARPWSRPGFGVVLLLVFMAIASVR